MSMHDGADCGIQHRGREGDALLRFVTAGSLATFIGTSCWLLGRHLAGTLRPPSMFHLLATSIACTLVVALGRGYEWSCSRALPERTSRRHRWFSVALVLFALAISFPRMAPLVTIAAWLPILGEELLWWFVFWPRLAPAAKSSKPPVAQAARSTPVVAVSNSSATRSIEAPSPEEEANTPNYENEEEECVDEEVEADESLLPASVSQQLTRERLPNGGEYLYGLVRCSFQSGEQNQNVHVAFCPPLDSIPDVTVRQLEGEDAHPQVGMAQTFGARFELRLSSVPAESTEVILQFEAKSAVAH